jgi:hypothetical protein
MIESHWLPWFDVVEEDIDLGQSEYSKISPPLFSRPRVNAVVSRPCLGCDSQAPTPQLCRNRLYCTRQALGR